MNLSDIRFYVDTHFGCDVREISPDILYINTFITMRCGSCLGVYAECVDGEIIAFDNADTLFEIFSHNGFEPDEEVIESIIGQFGVSVDKTHGFMSGPSADMHQTVQSLIGAILAVLAWYDREKPK